MHRCMFVISLVVVVAIFANGVDGAEFRKRNLEYGCFNCSFFKRLGPDCPLSLLDCDGCMEGFDEAQVTYEERGHKKPCRKAEHVVRAVSCILDQDCAPGFFCFQENFCAPCLDCRVFLRQQTVLCAKQIDQCGACLAGYYVDPEGSSPILKPCLQLTSMSTLQSQNETDGRIFMTGLIIIGCAIAFAAVIIVYFVFSFVKHRSTSNLVIDTPIEPPPPYIPPISEQSRFVTGFLKVKPEVECNARVFRMPRYNVTPLVPEQAVPRENVNENVPSNIDEETVACTWRPSEEVDSANSSNTFLGQFPRSSAGKTRRSDDSEEAPASKRHK